MTTPENAKPSGAQAQKKFIPFLPKNLKEFYLVCVPPLGAGYTPQTLRYHLDGAVIPMEGKRDPWRIKTECLLVGCPKCQQNAKNFGRNQNIPFRIALQVQHYMIGYIVYKNPDGSFRYADSAEPVLIDYNYRYSPKDGKRIAEDWMNFMQVFSTAGKDGKPAFSPDAAAVFKIEIKSEAIEGKTYVKQRKVHSFTGSHISLPQRVKTLTEDYLPISQGMMKLDGADFGQLIAVAESMESSYVQGAPGQAIHVKNPELYKQNMAILQTLFAKNDDLRNAYEYQKNKQDYEPGHTGQKDTKLASEGQNQRGPQSLSSKANVRDANKSANSVDKAAAASKASATPVETPSPVTTAMEQMRLQREKLNKERSSKEQKKAEPAPTAEIFDMTSIAGKQVNETSLSKDTDLKEVAGESFSKVEESVHEERPLSQVMNDATSIVESMKRKIAEKRNGETQK